MDIAERAIKAVQALMERHNLKTPDGDYDIRKLADGAGVEYTTIKRNLDGAIKTAPSLPMLEALGHAVDEQLVIGYVAAGAAEDALPTAPMTRSDVLERTRQTYGDILAELLDALGALPPDDQQEVVADALKTAALRRDIARLRFAASSRSNAKATAAEAKKFAESKAGTYERSMKIHQAKQLHPPPANDRRSPYVPKKPPTKK